jgi:streptomycin 6-kinase
MKAEKFSKGIDKLQRAKEKWGLVDDGDVFQTTFNLLQPVVYGGVPAMLKIPLAAEEIRGFRLLACWNGIGAAKVYQYDTDALVMERAMGERSLKQMVLAGQEDEANEIICRVADLLHSGSCNQACGLVPLRVWFRSLGVAAGRYGGWFTTAYETAGQLLDDPLDEVALHGDIHYDNILDSGAGQWIAIDPKGLVGESGFDLANIFCNPNATVASEPERLSKQARFVSGLADMDVKRLLRWIIAWSGLSASWMLEDAVDAQLPMRVGQLAAKELENYSP